MSTLTTEALMAFNAHYARIIDNDQVEQWPDCFTDDCLYLVTTDENHRQGMQAGMIYADSRGMLQDRIAALREANVYESHRYRHLIGLPVVVKREAGLAEVETPFMVARINRNGTTELFATGRYLDEVVDADANGLRLKQRIVVCDSQSIDTLLAIPL